MAETPPTSKPKARRSLLSLSLFIAVLFSPTPISAKIATSVITAQPTLASPPPSSDFADTKAFSSAILNSTNAYRKAHNASAMVWNATLASFASAYLAGDKVGAGCAFAHSGGPYGENLAIGYGNATASVEAWGDEGHKYDYGSPGFSEDTGHFTQLVWKNTSDVGCGRRLCDGKGWYLACEYWPRGNIIGDFKDEVGRPVNSARGISRSASLGFVTIWVVLWILL
ncbi:CAP domain-containing protein [Xylaria sp. FL1777]|nr:CAP domain-containing protein [Xylaria sp. FL1777]